MKLTRAERKWFTLADEQLDSFAHVTRAELARLQLPPEGNQAARRRELRRRARIEKLPAYLQNCLEQIAFTRQALKAHPNAGKAVYHALMAGMLSQYPNTADVRQNRVTKREAAEETNRGKGFSRHVRKSA